MPAKTKARAEKKEPARIGGPDAKLFSLHQEMLKLLSRVSGNKSKRTVVSLVDKGPLRSFLVALDDGAKLEGEALDGDISIQCLLGEVELTVGRAKKTLHVGDLLVVQGGAKGAQATEATVLLITVAAGASD